jgi:cell division protein FtsL
VGYEKQNIGEIFAANAMAEYEQTASTISIPKIREARDMVYNGAINTSSSQTVTANDVQPARNKNQSQRKVSPFTIVLLLLCGAVASVIYIGNILTVGQLMTQINRLQTKHQQMLNEQELLKARINRLSGLERIQQLAHDQLGLQNPKQFPVWIEIDQERISQFEDVLQQQMEHKR